MTLEQTIQTLLHYNAWRGGADIEQPNPQDITHALLSMAIVALRIIKEANNKLGKTDETSNQTQK